MNYTFHCYIILFLAFIICPTKLHLHSVHLSVTVKKIPVADIFAHLKVNSTVALFHYIITHKVCLSMHNVRNIRTLHLPRFFKLCFTFSSEICGRISVTWIKKEIVWLLFNVLIDVSEMFELFFSTLILYIKSKSLQM